MQEDERARAPGGVPVVDLAEIDSTSSEAMRRAARGETGPLWIAARRQTAGRGRSGRSWLSDDANLAASLLFAPDCDPAALPQLALVAGVAVHDAASLLLAWQPGSVDLALKWPNDLMVGPAKLAGILVESTTFGGRTLSVIGIGLNIASAPVIAGRDTTCLASLGACPPRHSVLAALAGRMQHWLQVWHSGAGLAPIRAAWLARAQPIGQSLVVNTGRDEFAGTFAGIDETGALLLNGQDESPDGASMTTRRFTFGDVTLAPPPKAEEHK